MAKTPVCTPQKAKKLRECISDNIKRKNKVNPYAVCIRSNNCHIKRTGRRR